MTSETFVTAIFLITAIIAAGVLVSAIYPSVYRASETFIAGSHEMDERMRTDIAIVNTVISAGDSPAYIWIKNTGVNPVGEGLIPRFDVFMGKTGEVRRLQYTEPDGDLSAGQWTYTLHDDNNNGLWDRGETLEIIAHNQQVVGSGDRMTFQVVLPNGVRRNIDFTVV